LDKNNVAVNGTSIFLLLLPTTMFAKRLKNIV